MAVKHVPVFANWHIAMQHSAVSWKSIAGQMGQLANWTELEQRGLIPRSPGREEAVEATRQWALEKSKLQREAKLEKLNPATKRK
jgi:hypothetical protein